MFHHTFRTKPAPTMKMDDMGGMDMSATPGMKMSSPDANLRPSTNTAPAMTMSPEPTTDLSTTLLWGRTRSLTDNSKENSYLAESLLRFASTNYLWTRLEDAGRSNELLLTPGSPLPPNFTETPIGHVAAYTLGYDHDIALGPHLLAAPGAQFNLYHSPESLRSTYGNTPTAEVFFIRFRLR
jgi:hypothetical protein